MSEPESSDHRFVQRRCKYGVLAHGKRVGTEVAKLLSTPAADSRTGREAREFWRSKISRHGLEPPTPEDSSPNTRLECRHFTSIIRQNFWYNSISGEERF